MNKKTLAQSIAIVLCVILSVTAFGIAITKFKIISVILPVVIMVAVALGLFWILVMAVYEQLEYSKKYLNKRKE